MTKTLLPGKDAPAEETIDVILSQLETAGIKVETTNWLSPAPNCWSVHLRCAEFPFLYTNGKGRNRKACYASALGEFIERLATNFLFAEYFLPLLDKKKSFLFYPDEHWFALTEQNIRLLYNKQGKTILSEELFDFYDPNHELEASHLVDNNNWDGKKKNSQICCLPFVNLSNHQTTYFPVSLLNNLYVSNGMAAGNTMTECQAQALSEIIERYVKNRVIGEGLSLPDVPDDFLSQEARDILAALDSAGYKVKIKDSSLGGRFPVICALLSARENGGVYAAFGASCRFQVAVERTLTELLQGRDLGALNDFSAPSHNLMEVADPFNLESHFVDSDGLLSWRMFLDEPDFNFVPWNFEGTTAQEFAYLARIVTENNFSLYSAEYNFLGIPCCRLIVPGMSEIYPVDDLVWNNKNATLSLRVSLLELPQLSRKKRTALLDNLENLGIHDTTRISQLIGIHFADDSPWSTLTVGELKAMVHLANKNPEDALSWSNWCVEHAGLPVTRVRLYRLMVDLIQFAQNGFEDTQFTSGLRRFYSEEEIVEAKRIVSGETTFPGLNFGADWLAVSPEHADLVNFYFKINILK